MFNPEIYDEQFFADNTSYVNDPWLVDFIYIKIDDINTA